MNDRPRPHAGGPSLPEGVLLQPESVEAIARRVADLLTAGTPSGLADAAALARALGVSRAWVYEHADELGAHRVGGGPRPRLRFDLDQARRALTSRGTGERSQPPAQPAPPAEPPPASPSSKAGFGQPVPGGLQDRRRRRAQRRAHNQDAA